jgi:hypothetical protein
LYSVLAQHNNGEFACWTNWNESTQSLNHGHTGIANIENALGILQKHFCDITDDPEHFSLKTCCAEVNKPAESEKPAEQESNICHHAHKHR